jgi:hypothetical protein
VASMPSSDRSHVGAARREERSVGEHIFIWIAWALAAAFWGASLTTMVEIFRAAGQALPAIDAPGAPGGSAYLVLVVTAFLVLALAIAYASIRSATSRSGAAGEAATAALYNSIERQGGEDMTSRSPDRRPQEGDFR